MLLTVFETYLAGILAVWAFTNTPGHRYCTHTYIIHVEREREKLKFTSTLHGGLPKYPIFRDFSEIRRMRKQCAPGVLFLRPSPRTPGYEASTSRWSVQCRVHMEIVLIACRVGKIFSPECSPQSSYRFRSYPYIALIMTMRTRAAQWWCNGNN